MAELAVQIVRFVDDTQPGVVACEFSDADGRRHTLIDKVPIFTTEHLDASSAYPQGGAVRCEVLSRWRDQALLEVLSNRLSYLEPMQPPYPDQSETEQK